MKKHILIFFLAISSFVGVGCNVKLGDTKTNDKVEKLEYASIVESMKDMSKEDSVVIYKICSGISQYIKMSKSIDSTPKMFGLIDKCKLEYSYTSEKYKLYSDAVESYLRERGYENPKTIVDSVSDVTKEIAREQVSKDMQNLASAAKNHLLNLKE